MEGISKEILESIDPWDYETPEQLIMDIIDKCEELPDQQWQTIDEFKANPVEGWCWIDTVNLSTKMCFFSGAVFYTTDELTGFYVPTNITHVMPIKTPEAPK